MIWPDVGGCDPAMHEKSVVFPAPLGPMTPTISPSITSKSTDASASSPPKRFDKWRTESNASATANDSHETSRFEKHHHDEQSAVDEEKRIAQRRNRQQFQLQRAENDRAENGAGDGADAADDRHQHDAEAQSKIKNSAGRDVLKVDRVEAAGDADQGRRDCMGDQLEPRRVDPHPLG